MVEKVGLLEYLNIYLLLKTHILLFFQKGRWMPMNFQLSIYRITNPSINIIISSDYFLLMIHRNQQSAMTVICVCQSQSKIYSFMIGADKAVCENEKEGKEGRTDIIYPRYKNLLQNRSKQLIQLKILAIKSASFSAQNQSVRQKNFLQVNMNLPQSQVYL